MILLSNRLKSGESFLGAVHIRIRRRLRIC